MKFMSMIKSSESFRKAPPPMALVDGIAKLAEEAMRKGVNMDVGGLLPSSAGTILRVAKGKLTVTDGPFTEAKEVVGGYAIYDVKSKDEALYWVKRFLDLHREHWPEWEGEAELRQFFEGPIPAPAFMENLRA